MVKLIQRNNFLRIRLPCARRFSFDFGFSNSSGGGGGGGIAGGPAEATGSVGVFDCWGDCGSGGPGVD